MQYIRSKIIYFLVPVLLLAGGIIFIGSVNNVDTDKLKNLSTQATVISLDPPDDLNFAGEIVPIRDYEVRERFDDQLIRYTYYHSATILNIKRAARWKPEMMKILRQNEIPQDFFYLCVAESHLSNATSPVGAKGFWQFMKPTAEIYDLEVSDQIDERYDPIKATYAACRYLKDSYRTFGNWTLVAASYNMGVGGIQAQMNRQKVDNYYDLYLNAETSAYIFRILALKTILEEPEKHGFILKEEQLYKPLEYKTVKVDTTINDLIKFSQQLGTNYKMLKVLNPWLLKDKLIIPQAIPGEKQKSYRIKIPKDAEIPESLTDMMPDSNRIGNGDTSGSDSDSVDSNQESAGEK